jgi:hypothetical protein
MQSTSSAAACTSCAQLSSASNNCRRTCAPIAAYSFTSATLHRRGWRLIAQLKLRYRYRNLLSAICGLSPNNGTARSPEYSSPKSSKYRWVPKNENTSSFKSAWSAALTSGGIGNGSSNFSAITRSTFASIALYSGNPPSPALADPPSRLPTHHAEAQTASGSLARGAQQRWNALRHRRKNDIAQRIGRASKVHARYPRCKSARAADRKEKTSSPCTCSDTYL